MQEKPHDKDTQLLKTIDNRVFHIIPSFLKGRGFTDRKLTDTPTDDLQVVNKKYVDDSTSGAGAKSCTFVIGPSSNSDSGDYDYTTDGTDDDVQIQAAIDALPTNGGRIVFREGTYTLGSAIITIAKNGVTLQGQGKGTIVTCKTNFNNPFFRLGHASINYENIVIKDIYFDGNKANQSISSTIIDNLTLTRAISDVEISGCYFLNAKNGCIILRDNAGTGRRFNINIHNNYFKDWDGYSDGTNVWGIYIVSDSTRNNGRISNNYFTNSSTTVSYIYGDVVCTVINNYFLFPDNFNIIGLLSCGQVIDNYFSGNEVTDHGTFGASCVLIDSCATVVSNTIQASLTSNAASIALRNCERISNNSIYAFGICISITGSAAGQSITGNEMQSIANCILLDTSAPSIAITGNQIMGGSDGTSSGILIKNTVRNVITGNVVLNNRDGAGNDSLYGIRENATDAGPNIITSNIVIAKSGLFDGAAISTQHTLTEISHNITVQP